MHALCHTTFVPTPQAIGLSTTDASRASFISTFTVLAVPFLAGSRLGDQREVYSSLGNSQLTKSIVSNAYDESVLIAEDLQPNQSNYF